MLTSHSRRVAMTVGQLSSPLRVPLMELLICALISSPGRLFQVEYAMDAISHAGSAIGILSPKEGVVLAAEKKVETLDDCRTLFPLTALCSSLASFWSPLSLARRCIALMDIAHVSLQVSDSPHHCRCKHFA